MPKGLPHAHRRVYCKGEMRYESHRRKVYQIGIIPVIAFNSVDEALPLCKALAEGGLPAAEVTFRTACAEECIRKIHEEMPEMLLGAGTVLTTEQADRAMAAGASFIVAPALTLRSASTSSTRAAS